MGGLLGLSYECHTCNSLWVNQALDTSDDLPQFGVFLDWEKDFDWWIEATDSSKVV